MCVLQARPCPPPTRSQAGAGRTRVPLLWCGSELDWDGIPLVHLRAKHCFTFRAFWDARERPWGWEALERCGVLFQEGLMGQLVPRSMRAPFREQPWQICHFTSASLPTCLLDT